jgi:rhamnogalacturonan endolyase
MAVENLNRGLIAVRAGDGYYLSWRLLANEPYNTGFNVYRGTTKLNSSPVTGTNIYTDASAALNSAYTVRAVIGGVEQAASDPAIVINSTQGSNAGYIQIDLQRPATGAQGGTYSPGDGSAGDLNGDGVYEIILKWDPSNAQDNSKSGVTDNVFIDAYTLTGTRLWRIDLGQNIRAGAHYTQFLVFDFDGDGKAEVMMKTAPGTKDGTGTYIKTGPAASAGHTTAYRNDGGYILTGPEYITVFEGATGKELATADYWPARGTVSSWGDNYGNRVDRFNAAVAYLDGERPSAVFERGYYTRLTMAAWDWRDGQLTRRWTFDSGASGNSAYAGQGNHQLSVADVDNSGKHSIIAGASVIGPDGKGKHTTGFGHGDALHVAHMIKGTATPQIFMPHESGGHGVLLRQANNGTHIFHIQKADTDVGRGCAGHIDPAKGFTFWASSGMGLFDISGNVTGSAPSQINHLIWWGGDLSRELLDGNTVTRWRASGGSTALLTATGYSSVNGTKSNPVLQADLFGDWREEVILSNGSNALRVYTSTMATTHRLVTLMHDPVYRVAVAWQNSSYNQPPHPGYYIASDMNFPPPALNVAVVGGSTPPPPPPPPPEPARINGAEFIDYIDLFDLQNASAWSVRTGFAVGDSANGDRTHYVTSLPAQLAGAEWVRPAAQSRLLTVDTVFILKMKKNGVVHVAYEDRIATKPAWLAANGFTANGQTMAVNDGSAEPRTFTIYSKPFTTGQTAVMGKNSNDGTTMSLMYLVAVNAGDNTSVINGKNAPAKYSLNIIKTAGGTFNIGYSIKNRGTVRVDIFNIKGGKVRTLVNAHRDAGVYQERLPVSGLAAGAYIVKLRAGTRTLQRTVLLTK